jgi:hypothetical protein
MKRRDALSSFGLGLASMVSMPAWASNWQKSTLPIGGFLNIEEQNLLTELTETIIPSTRCKVAGCTRFYRAHAQRLLQTGRPKRI